MKQLVGLALFLALAETPLAAQDDPAEKQPERITVRVLAVPGGRKNLVIGGQALLREDTLLKVSVARTADSYRFGNDEIVTTVQPPFPRFCPVKRKQYRVEIPGSNAWGAGLYHVTVETVRDGGKTKVTKEVAGWTETLVRHFDDHLTEFDGLASEALQLIEKVNQAAAAGPKAFGNLKKQATGLNAHLAKIHRSAARKAYHIATNEIAKPLGNILGMMDYFKWDANGNFVGPNSYYGAGKDSQGKEFSFPNEAGYVRRASEIAGREYALWIIREFRRKGSLAPSVINGIRKHAEHPGLIDFATMLEGLTAENVDQVERRVRKTPEKKEEPPQAPKPGAPAKPENK